MTTEGPITRTADWSEVKVDDVVRAVDGTVWRIIAREVDGVIGSVTMAEVGGTRTGTTIPQAPTVEVLLTHQEILEREQIVAQTIDALLGGEVVAEKEGDGPWKVAQSYPDPGSLRSHAWLMHGVPLSKDHDLLSKLNEEHEQLHRDHAAGAPVPKGHKEHVHTEEFVERPQPTLVEVDAAIEAANSIP